MVCVHNPTQLSCGRLSYEGEEAPLRSHPVRGSVGALKRAPLGAPRVWSDLDRSTVWAETAVPSRFLHVTMSRDIDASDLAIRCGCYQTNSSVKESTRSGRLSPHSAPIEVGPHPRRLPRSRLESSSGALHRMRSQRRFLSFIGEAPAAQLRRMMITDPYVTTFF